MGDPESIHSARIILEAVHFASSAELASLQQLIAREPEILQLELVLRIILTYLPESTEPGLYIDLLQQLAHGAVHEPSLTSLRHVQPGTELSDDEARRQVRQLHLLQIVQEQDLQAGCTDLLSLFLVHRARRIDEETGSIPEVQQLLEPFIDRDPCLCTWLISNVLPLRRLDYDYYPQAEDAYTLEAFEKLQGRPAIDSLLSRSTRAHDSEAAHSARDIRGIVGPWIYGASSRKRRKTHHDRRRSSLTISEPSEHSARPTENDPHRAWPDVNEWIIDLALRDFHSAAKTIEQWNGPGDVDYDCYCDEQKYDADTVRNLEQQYAQVGLAAIYAGADTSHSTFEESNRILRKVARLSDLDPPPAIDDPPGHAVTHISEDYLDQLSDVHLLHNALLRPQNPVTHPEQRSLTLASLVLRSCVLLQRLGHPKTCKALIALATSGRREVQMEELHRTLQKVPIKTRDESSWADVRQQLLWLRDWRYPVSDGEIHNPPGSVGVFCQVEWADLEVELLKALLRASCELTWVVSHVSL